MEALEVYTLKLLIEILQHSALLLLITFTKLSADKRVFGELGLNSPNFDSWFIQEGGISLLDALYMDFFIFSPWLLISLLYTLNQTLG